MKNIRANGEFRSLMFALLLVLTLSFVVFKVDWWILVGLVLIQLFYIILQQKQVQGSSLVISDKQFPNVSKIINEVAGKFDILVPDAYVQYDPYINAFVMGFKKPYILVLTSSLVEAMSENELRFVIGHEMGHIKMGHSRLKSFVFPLDRNIFMFTFLFNSWLRKTEYTADRCGIFFSQDIKYSVNSLLKLAVGSKLYDQINIKEVIRQVGISGDQKIEKVSESLLDHPFTMNRIKKLAEFDKKPITSI